MFAKGTGTAVAMIAAVTILALLLCSCATVPDLETSRPTTVCKALIGPIRYNSANPKSRRHAGPDLAVDLKQRNQVGENLRCPQYR